MQLILEELYSLQVHKWLRLLFVFLFCFVSFPAVDEGRREVADVWLSVFGLVLLCFVQRATILLLLIESRDPLKAEWVWDQY